MEILDILQYQYKKGEMTIKEKSCCFTGHRKVRKSEFDLVQLKLKEIITKLIEANVTMFICGGDLGFDTMAALEVLEQRKIYKNISLIMALPCKEQCKNWKEKEQIIYKNIIQRANKIIYVSEEYSKGCMLKRNRYMIDNSSYCICYLRYAKSGTSYTVNYAKNKDLILINI